MTAVLPGDLSSPTAGPILAPEATGHDWHGLLLTHWAGSWVGCILLDVDQCECATLWIPGQPGLYYRPTGVLRLPVDRAAVCDHAARWLARHYCAAAGWPEPSGVIWQHRPGMMVGGILAVSFAGRTNFRTIGFYAMSITEGIYQPPGLAEESIYRLPIDLRSATDPAAALRLACLHAAGRAE